MGKTIQDFDKAIKLGLITEQELQAYGLVMVVSATPTKRDDVAMSMSERRLRDSGCLAGDANLFNERHVRVNRPKATQADVLRAYHSLGLVNEPWPSKHDAQRQGYRVQGELDRLLPEII